MYPIFKQEAAKKAGQLRIRCVTCCVRVNTVLYGFNFRGDQIFVDFYEDLYTWC